MVINKTSFFTKTKSRFESVVLHDVLGPPQLPPHLTVTLYLSSSGSKARGEVDTALKRRGAVSAQKALQGCETEIREFLEGTEEKKTLPPEGVIGLPSRKIHFFTERRKKVS